MKLLVILALVAAPVQAFANDYVVVCTAPCVASDGTTQPAGTVLNRIVAPQGFNPGPGLQLQSDTGQALYSPPQTTIAPLDLIARFTAAEQQAVQTAAQSDWSVALFITKLNAASAVDVSDPETAAGFALLVQRGLITQARASQILTLSSPSP